MHWLGKAWSWLKKYWKWLLFPIGILLALNTAAAVAYHRKKAVLPPDLDEETQRALRRLRTADWERNIEVLLLEREKVKKLRDMSGDQYEELVELQKASTEEVVQWFNRL